MGGRGCQTRAQLLDSDGLLLLLDRACVMPGNYFSATTIIANGGSTSGREPERKAIQGDDLDEIDSQ